MGRWVSGGGTGRFLLWSGMLLVTVSTAALVAAIGANGRSARPVEPAAVAGAPTILAAGDRHACEVVPDGRVVCWGLGFPIDEDDAGAAIDAGPTPTAVPGIEGAIGVASGWLYSCVVLDDGTARCWGVNNGGGLGNGTTSRSNVPVAVSGLTGAATITAGYDHTCALIDDGTARCWGNNSRGQLGDGSEFNERLTPVAVSGLTGAVAISAGLEHSCALIDDGTARCWGSSFRGQLGDGFTLDRTNPVVVAGLDDAVAIDTGWEHTCAVRADGTVWCWGSNDAGQLGDGTTAQRTTPVAVVGVTGAVAVATGRLHSCAVLADGGVRCWGDDTDGQLGSGPQPTTGSTTAVVAVGIDNATGISAARFHTCAELVDGTACWGRGEAGQRGDGYREANPTPGPVIGLDAAAVMAEGVDHHACAARADGTVACWGSNHIGQVGDGTITDRLVPTTVPGLTGAVGVSTGLSTSCALKAEGTVWCWGWNVNGQLGDGTTIDRTAPVNVDGVTNAVAVDNGWSVNCALLDDGTVSCWGFDVGPVATPVAGLSGVVDLVVGGDHACVAIDDGTVQCWGQNIHGQLGDGTDTPRNTPAPVPGITTAVAVSAGTSFSCALLADGTARCWGNNFSGQVGDGTQTNRRSPVTVSGLAGAETISSGYAHSCARLGDATVRCWGAATHGQTGQDGMIRQTTPIRVAGVTGATEVTAGGFTSCAAVPQRGIRCWGRNLHGQLGNALGQTRAAAGRVPTPGGGVRLLASPCVLATGTITPGTPLAVPVAGRCGLPSERAVAVVVSIAAVDPAGAGNLRLSAAGVAPTGGVVNYTINGLANANTVIIPLPASGLVDLAANNAGTGYRLTVLGHVVAPRGDGLGYLPVTPCAVADSRPAQGPTGGYVGPFTPGAPYPDVDVVGSFPAAQGGGATTCGIPADAEAVMVNAVAVGAAGGSGGLAVGPGGTEPDRIITPFAAIGLNNAAAAPVPLIGGQTIATNVVGDDGSPSTHIRLVALGAFTGSGDGYTVVNPCAVFDSRPGQGATGPFLGERVAGTATSYRIVGSPGQAQGGVADGCGVPAGASAVLINLVAIQPAATGNLRAYATGSAPTGGVLNFAPTIPAMNNSSAVVVPLSAAGEIDVFVNAPSHGANPATHVRGVVLGYYT